MSQPALQHMGTHPKNATQHPGHIVLKAEGHAKRHTKAQMIADRQRELEASQASEQAIQKGHQHIATLQEQMATDQAAAHVSMASGDIGARVAIDKVVGAKTKRGGPGGVLVGGANIENPASDEELGAPPARGKGRKTPLETPVRDAIQAVAGTESLIDPSTKARDGDQMSKA
ncbi:hypothetical protein BDR03DRAFT_1007533 [Suillus americanus]|nr:hypothetical protein BDR03DRAFT_1007533 [Suillus americanus]